MIANKLELTKMCDSAIIVVWACPNFFDMAIVVAIFIVPAVIAEQLC